MSVLRLSSRWRARVAMAATLVLGGSIFGVVPLISAGANTPAKAG